MLVVTNQVDAVKSLVFLEQAGIMYNYGGVMPYRKKAHGTPRSTTVDCSVYDAYEVISSCSIRSSPLCRC
jgi:hypothetical protein